MDPTLQVSPLNFITRPMGNTKLENPVWYVCTIPNASMHRQDGKKLPFVNGFLKVWFREDQNFLNEEIDVGNPYLRLANEAEIGQARMIEDPLGVIKDAVRAEVANDFSIEDLEKLLAEKRNRAQQPQNPASVPPPPPPGESDTQRLQRLAAAALAAAKAGNDFKPGSTANVPGAQSNSKG